MFITGFAAWRQRDSNAPKHAKVLSKPIHLRELVTEVTKMLAAYGLKAAGHGLCLASLEPIRPDR